MRIPLLIVFAFFLSSSTTGLFAKCEEIAKNFPWDDLGEPVLKGVPVLFPEIKLKVTKRDTSEIMPLQEVSLRYVWRHFLVSTKYDIYGKLRDAFDITLCTTNADGTVSFPEYNLVPKAWYDGPKIQTLFLGKNIPRFLELELSVENWHYLITKDQIKKIRNNKIKEPVELRNYSSKTFVPPIKVEIIP